MRQKRAVIVLALLLTLLVLAACAPGTGKYTAAMPAGFLQGVWHGWIAPITLIAGLFNPDVRIYEPFNSGWWYDLGFYVAVISGFGGLSLTRRKRN
jgi:hypothetical protein